MTLQRIKPKTRKEWLQARRNKGIGASEAAAVVGLSPWMTASELFAIKTGAKQPEELAENDDINRGVRLENPLRNLYKAMNPDYKVTHHPYDMLFQKERDFMFATLDGEVKDANGRKGILEVKTASPNGKAGWGAWDGQIYQPYYIQICHQLACTGFDFVDVFAALRNRENDLTVRTYHFERADVEEDIRWIIDKETEFWESVKNKSIPPMTILF